MRAALAAHDAVLRNAIETHRGVLFKHTGDGVCAAFSSPKSAVDAAVAAQRALELPVRMGLATGEAETAGQGLLRCRFESSGAGNDRWARRSDPGGGLDSQPIERSRPAGSGTAALARCADGSRRVPSPRSGSAL